MASNKILHSLLKLGSTMTQEILNDSPTLRSHTLCQAILAPDFSFSSGFCPANPLTLFLQMQIGNHCSLSNKTKYVNYSCLHNPKMEIRGSLQATAISGADPITPTLTFLFPT